MAERFQTLHPDPTKAGVNISREKYERIRAAILEAIGKNPGLTFTGLAQEVQKRVSASFEGSVPWYVTTVKLDLEARGLIERVPGRGPQRLRLAR